MGVEQVSCGRPLVESCRRLQSSRLAYTWNIEGRSQHTLRGDEMGVEQARQSPLSSLKSRSDRWWDLAIGCSGIRYASKRLNFEKKICCNEGRDVVDRGMRMG